MKTAKSHPVKLDEFEQALEDNFENASPIQGEEKKKTLNLLKEGAKKYTHQKSKRITIKVYDGDLECLKRMAMEDGLPYQTFITSMLHKLSIGRLVDTRKV